jgi:tRNA nucleotidyltransferase (CCA-adding enzyme)
VKLLRPFRERVLLTAFIAAGPDSTAGDQIKQYLEKWQGVQTVLNGNDLIEMGVPRGPEIGRLLEDLLAARLDGKITTEAEERAFIESLAAA